MLIFFLPCRAYIKEMKFQLTMVIVLSALLSCIHAERALSAQNEDEFDRDMELFDEEEGDGEESDDDWEDGSWDDDSFLG